MPNEITKRLSATVAEYSSLELVDGKPEMKQEKAVFKGVQSPERINKLLRKRLGSKPFLISSIASFEQKLYAISLEDFILHAHLVDEDAADNDGADETEDGAEAEQKETEPDEGAEADDKAEADDALGEESSAEDDGI